MRKGIHLTIGILSGILFTQNIWAQTLKEPVIESQAVVVMDMDSGDILYEKNGKEKLYPASIVKLLTALVTAEEGKLDDIVIFFVRCCLWSGRREWKCTSVRNGR